MHKGEREVCGGQRPGIVLSEWGEIRGGVRMSEGERQTGISNTVYNLVSVFYHAAQGGTVYAKYIEDAEGQGDQELADFFLQVQEEGARRAQRAKELLDAR
jgi:hypothetical protein